MSAFPTLGLTYDDVDVQDLDGIFLQIQSGLYDGVDVRGQDVTVPYLDGQVPRSRRRHNRRILLRGFVRGTTGATEALRQMAYSANARLVDSVFDPARDPAVLEVTFPDTSHATITARPLNIIHTPLVIEEYTSLDIELLSTDPDWEFFDVGTVVPTTLMLTLTGLPPTVRYPIYPTTAALVVTAYAPTVTSSG